MADATGLTYAPPQYAPANPARGRTVGLLRGSERGVSARRIFVDLGAIACWLVLWWISMTVGLELGLKMAGPQGRDGYLFISGIWGVVFISPLGLVCSTFFLWGKRHLPVFIACGAAVGLAITLWPALAWVFPWATW